MAKTKDTSPMIKARRIPRQIRIQEINDPPTVLFDRTVEYPTTDLPEWFVGLQSIIEDETFTSLEINLGDKVRYQITVVGPLKECDCCHKRVAKLYDVTPAALGDTAALHVCKDCYDLETNAPELDGYHLDLGIEE